MLTKHKDGYSENVTLIADVRGIRDRNLNDSDKTFTVPANQRWKINYGFIEFASTAAVGNRQLVVEVKNELGELVGRISAGAVQAASLTRYYQLMKGTYRETAFVNGEIQVPIPADAYLGPGFTVRVYDSAAIAAAADDMFVSLSIEVNEGVEIARL